MGEGRLRVLRVERKGSSLGLSTLN